MNVEVNCTEPSSPSVSVPWLIVKENTELVSKLIWILKTNCDLKFKNFLATFFTLSSVILNLMKNCLLGPFVSYKEN